VCTDDSPGPLASAVWHDVESALEIDPEPVDSVVIPRVLDDLEALTPAVLVPAHCTGWRAQHAISARFPTASIPNAVGTTFHL
jgi:metal-dependent hydrolase (beta-lactamase superfamily II)